MILIFSRLFSMLINFLIYKRDLVTVNSITYYLAAFFARHMTFRKKEKIFCPVSYDSSQRSLTIKRFGVGVNRGTAWFVSTLFFVVSKDFIRYITTPQRLT